MSNRTTDRDSDAKTPVQDVLGLTLFALFSFGVLSVFFVVLGRNSDWWITQQIQVLINALGPVPSMMLCAGLAGLGVILFLRAGEVQVPRHVLGIVLVALGAALLIGGIQTGKGGAIGALLPETLGATAGSILTVLLGLVVCGATVYSLWWGAVRGTDSKPLEPSALVPPRRSEADGVSNAEAMALQAPVGSRMKSEIPAPPVDVRIGGGIPAGAVPLTGEESALEEDEETLEEQDLRFEAQQNDPFATEPFAATETLEPEVAGEPEAMIVAETSSATEELAPPSASWEVEGELDEPEPVREPEVPSEPASEPDFELAPEPEFEDVPESLDEVEPEPVEEPTWASAELDETTAAVAEEGEVADASWQAEAEEPEAAELDEEELEDDEEWEEDEAAELEEEDEDEAEAAELEEDEEEDEDAELEEDEDVAAELDEEEDDEEEWEEEEDAEAAELDEEEEDEDADDEWEEDEEAEAAELDEEEEEEDAEAAELDDDEEEAAEYEEEEEPEAAELEEDDEEEDLDEELEDEAAELDEDEVEDDEEWEDEDEDEEAEAAELQEEDADDDEELVYEEEAAEPVAAQLDGDVLVVDDEAPAEPETEPETHVAAEAEEAPADDPEPAVAAPAWEQNGLFDEVAADSAPDHEPQVELAPVPPAAKVEETTVETAVEPAAAASSMLYEAGLLILEENRVAVSMLQRRFSIDFDEACVLLDKLQELGLIGPYMGGRNREILIDLAAWQELEPEVLAAT